LYNLTSGGLEPYEYDIYGLDASSGNVVWNYSLPVHYYAYFPDSPVVANGMLYVAPTAGQVYAFDKQSASPTEDGSLLANSIGSNFLLIGIIIILISAVVVLLLLNRKHRKIASKPKV
jgi:outer membrane protein assembly factor BamB